MDALGKWKRTWPVGMSEYTYTRQFSQNKVCLEITFKPYMYYTSASVSLL